jgi:hypothetical protein
MALVNLIIQIVLTAGVIVAFYLARKHKLRWHCRVMRTVIAIEILSIIRAMTWPLVDFVREPPPLRLLTTEAVVHHSLGLLVIFLFIYVNLVFEGVIKTGWGLKAIMRTAAVLWAVTLILGIHLYVRIHV